MLQYEKNDESLHHYGRRYQHVLSRTFPDKFPYSPIKNSQAPYQLCEKNRAFLYQFFQQIEMDASLSLARRARIFGLLGKIGEMLAEKNFGELTKEDIQELVARVRREPTWSLTTQNYHLKAFKRFLRFLNGGEDYPACISWLKIRERCFSHIKKEDLITEEEMARLLESTSHPMHKCMFALLWEGLRVGELGTLRCRNITFEGREVYISVRGKTGDRNVLSISGAPFIRQWMDSHPTQDPNDWLFVITSNYNQGKRLGYSSFRTILKKACKKAGISKDIHPHLFRHSSITDRRRKGMRQREASAFYGVSGQVMSAVYDHLADTDVRNEVRRVFGMKETENTLPKISPKICAYCQKINPHYSTLCLNCGNPLTEADAIKHRNQFQQIEEENTVIKNELHSIRSVMAKLAEGMKSMNVNQKEKLFTTMEEKTNE